MINQLWYWWFNGLCILFSFLFGSFFLGVICVSYIFVDCDIVAFWYWYYLFLSLCALWRFCWNAFEGTRCDMLSTVDCVYVNRFVLIIFNFIFIFFISSHSLLFGWLMLLFGYCLFDLSGRILAGYFCKLPMDSSIETEELLALFPGWEMIWWVWLIFQF